MNSCCVALSDRRKTSLAGDEAVAVVVDIAEASGGVGVAEGRGEEGRGEGCATSVLRPERSFWHPEKWTREGSRRNGNRETEQRLRLRAKKGRRSSRAGKYQKKAEEEGREKWAQTSPGKSVGTNHNRQTQPQREVRRAAGSARHHHEGRGWKSKNRPREQCKKREQFVHRK